MNYVTSVVMQFISKKSDEVIVKARGKFISRAVDVAEVSSKRFMEGNIAVKDIKIDSEDFKNKEGRPIRVSTIYIHLDKLNGVKPTPTNFEIRPKKEEKSEEVAEPEVKEEPKVEEAPVEESAVEETPAEPVVEETPAEEPVAEPEAPAETEQTNLDPETSE